MSTVTTKRPSSSKVKLTSGKFIQRVVKNVTKLDGFTEGEISMNGENVTVRRKAHSRVWAVVDDSAAYAD